MLRIPFVDFELLELTPQQLDNELSRHNVTTLAELTTLQPTDLLHDTLVAAEIYRLLNPLDTVFVAIKFRPWRLGDTWDQIYKYVDRTLAARCGTVTQAKKMATILALIPALRATPDKRIVSNYRRPIVETTVRAWNLATDQGLVVSSASDYATPDVLYRDLAEYPPIIDLLLYKWLSDDPSTGIDMALVALGVPAGYAASMDATDRVFTVTRGYLPTDPVRSIVVEQRYEKLTLLDDDILSALCDRYDAPSIIQLARHDCDAQIQILLDYRSGPNDYVQSIAAVPPGKTPQEVMRYILTYMDSTGMTDEELLADGKIPLYDSHGDLAETKMRLIYMSNYFVYNNAVMYGTLTEYTQIGSETTSIGPVHKIVNLLRLRYNLA